MPIYEYHCPDCDRTFEMLRSMNKANAPAPCGRCGSANTTRAISLFSAISKGENGASRSIAGAGCGCGPSCSGGHCATCSR